MDKYNGRPNSWNSFNICIRIQKIRKKISSSLECILEHIQIFIHVHDQNVNYILKMLMFVERKLTGIFIVLGEPG